jgi:hypothetical protein
VAVGAALFASAACTTTYVTPLAVAQPNRVDLAADQSVPPGEKVFVLPRDWQYGTWVIKKGATLTFRADGLGSFSCVAFSQFNVSSDELHLQAISYGRDGNALFAVPGSDTGMPLHLRQPNRDFPYDAKFGFDPRYFDSIHDVKFLGRLRLVAEHMGHPQARRASLFGWRTLDTGRSRPETYPPTP